MNGDMNEISLTRGTATTVNGKKIWPYKFFIVRRCLCCLSEKVILSMYCCETKKNSLSFAVYTMCKCRSYLPELYKAVNTSWTYSFEQRKVKVALTPSIGLNS